MEIIKIKPAGTKEVEVILGKFRLTNGLCLSSVSCRCEYIPAKEELALEATDNNGSYIVIAFIEYDEKADCCDMRTVGPRFYQNVTSYEDRISVQTLMKMADDIILAANNIED